MDRKEKIALGILIAAPIGAYALSRLAKSNDGYTDNYANATGMAVAPQTDPLSALIGKLQTVIGKNAGSSSTGSTTTSGGAANTGKPSTGGISGLKNKADRFQGINTGKNGNTGGTTEPDELDQLQKELNDLMNFKPVKPQTQQTTGGYYDPSMYAQPAPQSSGMGIDLSGLDWKMILMYGGLGVAGIWLIRKVMLNMKAKKGH